MIIHQLQKPAYQIYTQLDQSYFQSPSGQTLAVREHLRSNGVHSQQPFPVIMGVHSVELLPGADLGAVQILINEWVTRQAAPPEQAAAPPADPVPNRGRARSQCSMFGDA